MRLPRRLRRLPSEAPRTTAAPALSSYRKPLLAADASREAAVAAALEFLRTAPPETLFVQFTHQGELITVSAPERNEAAA